MFNEYAFRDWLYKRIADAYAFNKNGRDFSEAVDIADSLSPMELVCYLGEYLTYNTAEKEASLQDATNLNCETIKSE